MRTITQIFHDRYGYKKRGNSKHIYAHSRRGRLMGKFDRFDNMTEEELARDIEHINQMSQLEMAKLWRFAPMGHPYFRRGTVLAETFERRYKKLGGMTPGISKQLGWGDLK